MRVLFWSEHFWPYIGGGEIFATKLITALQGCGYEFTVVTSHDYLDLPDQANYSGIPIYRLPFRKALRSHDVAKVAELSRSVKEIKEACKPDLVHVNGINPSVLFHLRTADAHAAPTLVRMNQEVLITEGPRLDSLTIRTLHAADWVCCVSSAVLAQVRQVAPQVSTLSSVIYNAVELSFESPTPQPIDTPVLLCLGRLVPAKGFDLALTALASLISRYPNIGLVIAGDGPSRADLERQAAELGVNDAVKFIGWVAPDKVPALIDAATIVLMPSWREGLPTVALQAGSMARPIVATRSGGLTDVVIHQQTGILIEKGDNQGLAEAVAFLLENPERTQKMGMAARERTRMVFGWRRCIGAYNDLYRRLVREFAARTPATSQFEKPTELSNQ